jgi:putative NADH-flavin reductase
MGPFGDDPGTVYSDAIATLTAEMAAAGVTRLAILANARVLDERPLTGPFAAVSEEHRRALATLRGTDLEWTVLATPLLSDDPATGSYDAVIDAAPPRKAIARADFATALVGALDRPEWVGHAVGVSG